MMRTGRFGHDCAAPVWLPALAGSPSAALPASAAPAFTIARRRGECACIAFTFFAWPMRQPLLVWQPSSRVRAIGSKRVRAADASSIGSDRRNRFRTSAKTVAFSGDVLVDSTDRHDAHKRIYRTRGVPRSTRCLLRCGGEHLRDLRPEPFEEMHDPRLPGLGPGVDEIVGAPGAKRLADYRNEAPVRDVVLDEHGLGHREAQAVDGAL